MFELDDPRWEIILGNDCLSSDPRPLLRKLGSIPDADPIWDALVQELCQTEHIGLAPFAAVPYLVHTGLLASPISGRLIHLIASIEILRFDPTSPRVPNWLWFDYKLAVETLASKGLQQVSQEVFSSHWREAFALFSLWKGSFATAINLLEYSEDYLFRSLPIAARSKALKTRKLSR